MSEHLHIFNVSILCSLETVGQYKLERSWITVGYTSIQRKTKLALSMCKVGPIFSDRLTNTHFKQLEVKSCASSTKFCN
jgi:hypothetical protein